MTSAYPRYRDSGVEWLGRIPEHWDIRKLDHVLSTMVGGGTPDTKNAVYWADDEEDGIPWVAISDMSNVGQVVTTEKQITPRGLASKRLKLLPSGTIIYSMYASVGAVARLGIPAVTNQAILGLFPGTSLLAEFLYWWCAAIREPVLALTRSNTQSNLNAGTVRRFPIAVPPLEEQRAIAAFLDRETSKVDELVVHQEQLLERLAEYRTALIANTVTRGLPPEAAMAAGLDPYPDHHESGVEWLGQVPGHWNTRQLGTALSAMVGGGTPDTKKDQYWADDAEEGIPWVAIGDMSGGELVTTTEKRVTSLGVVASRLKLLPVGTVIYAMYASVGVVARLGIPAVTNQAILGLFPGSSLVPDFLYWWLAAIRDLVLAFTRSNTQDNLNAGTVRRFPISVPPIEEQRAIAAFLDCETASVDTLVGQAELAVERLLEYRSALITHAVTGKMDVRGSVAHAGAGGR